MAIRLQELHAAAVHYPIALLPIAIGADAAGRATQSRGLLGVGRFAIRAAAAGAVGAALTGLIAQEEVNVEGAVMDTLITHRNLNLSATVVATLMARWRSRHKRPSLAYLATGLAGIGIVSYTAYLGGMLVYHHGVGVEPAGGQYRKVAPELTATGPSAAFVSAAATDLVHGATHLAREMAQGRLAPSLGLGLTEAEPTDSAAPQ